MKTQVVHLDAHDDLISIRDRMAWAKSPRILLIWPPKGQVDVRPLDLTLLRRHAEGLGAELGLVTRDRAIRAAARSLGMPVFYRAADAQKKAWTEQRSARPTRRFARPDLRAISQKLPGSELFSFSSHPVRRVIIFAVGVLAVLSIMLVFIPSAQIKLAFPQQKQTLTIAVSADPDTDSVQISGIVPQHNLTLELAGADSVLVTSKAVVPDQAAMGEALLMNLTDTAVSIPVGTIFLTSSTPALRFEVLNPSLVPAGKGKTIKMPIRAVLSGPSGNILPGAITAFEGTLGSVLAVTNPGPLSGGTEKAMLMPGVFDRESLLKRLLVELDRQARERFSFEISHQDTLLPSTFARVRILEQNFSPQEGQAGEKLFLNLRVEYSIAYAAFADLQLLAKRVLDASLPPGFVALPGQIALQPISSANVAQGIVRWQLRAQRSVRSELDTSQVISLVLGKTSWRASSLLRNNYGLAESPQIIIRPSWWPWLPFLPMQISVTG